VHATFTDPLPAEISADKQMLCTNDSIVLLANGGVTRPEEKLSWRHGVTVLEAKGPGLTVKEPGTYVLEIDDDIPGCAGKDTMEIGREEFSVTLPEKQGIPEGSNGMITPLLNPEASSYIYAWSPPEGVLSPVTEKIATITPVQDEQLYHLQVTTPSGCTAEDSVLVFMVKRIYIPSSFSPNSDGRNDTFQIFNADQRIERMRIYNRWGELIFQSHGYDQPWDGTYKNAPVPAGSYPYVIKTAEQEINGTVLLLR
jgi:gliding motility-associated-like protein